MRASRPQGPVREGAARRDPDFTGISSPYEAPEDADLEIDTTEISIEDAVDEVFDHLVDGGWIDPALATCVEPGEGSLT